MALPLILSLLGSAGAGAGVFGAVSPLLAGAIGSGLGSYMETGDLGKGLTTGLTAGMLGGLGGMVTGGAAGAGAAGATDAAAGAAATAAPQATGLSGLFQNMPSGLTPAANPALTDPSFMGRIGQATSGATPFGDIMSSGFNQGTMTGAGLGTALGGMMMSQPQTSFGKQDDYFIPQADPANRQTYSPPADYRPGVDGEFTYFDPSPQGSRFATQSPSDMYSRPEKKRGVFGFAQGGMVNYQIPAMPPMRMQAGGLADIGQAVSPDRFQQAPNDKDIVEGAIVAVQGQMPEEQAAMVLAAFVDKFGEDALRKLVDDVQQGKAPQAEGAVRGPGDGMSDMVPGEMADGGSDVLLSDGEFVVPADVVSGIGNGSTEAGASELERMMSRVRQDRTGTAKQAPAITPERAMPA